jgi:hypothetical protein
MRRARPLDRLRVSSSSSAASVCSSAASALGSVSATPAEASSKRLEHHRDARQDRFLDALERLVEARLLFGRGMPPYGPAPVKPW